MPTIETEAIHGHFGLSYCNYLVLHRTILQSMPDEWQARFVDCLRELDAAACDLPIPTRYDVRVLAREPEHIDSVTCEPCEGSGENDEGQTCEYCDGDGTQDADGWETPEEVGITFDPIPHYDRGRARVELNL